MPAPILFAGGCVIPTLLSAKAVAFHAVPSVAQLDVAAAIVAAWTGGLITRSAYQRLPDWIKEDVSFQNLLHHQRRIKPENDGVNSDGDTDHINDHVELGNLTSVIEKLGLWLQSGLSSCCLHDDSIADLQIAFLLFVQLNAQFRTLSQSPPSLRTETAPTTTDASSFLPSPRRRSYSSRKTDHLSLMNRAEIRAAFDWAVWAYESDSDRLQQLFTEHSSTTPMELEVLQHNPFPSTPGTVGHFLAVSHAQQTVVIGIKGTSTLEDFFTDCCGRAVPLRISSNSISCNSNGEGRMMDDEEMLGVEVTAKQSDTVYDEESDREIEIRSGHERILIQSANDTPPSLTYCHEGILFSAQRLADVVDVHIKELVVSSKRYRCILTGHSLGAGAAALLALVLRSRFPELTHDDDIAMEEHDRHRQRLCVYAFAPPPVLDYAASYATSTFIYSFVNGSDIVPRFSLVNIKVLVDFLRHTMCTKMHERNWSVHTMTPASASTLLRKLVQGGNDTTDLLLTLPEFVQAREDALLNRRWNHAHHPHDLFIPGQVLILEAIRRPEDDLTAAAATKSATATVDENIEVSITTTAQTQEMDVWHTSGPSDVLLRLFELQDGWQVLSDHICSSYESSLDRFCGGSYGTL